MKNTQTATEWEHYKLSCSVPILFFDHPAIALPLNLYSIDGHSDIRLAFQLDIQDFLGGCKVCAFWEGAAQIADANASNVPAGGKNNNDKVSYAAVVKALIGIYFFPFQRSLRQKLPGRIKASADKDVFSF